MTESNQILLLMKKMMSQSSLKLDMTERVFSWRQQRRKLSQSSLKLDMTEREPREICLGITEMSQSSLKLDMTESFCSREQNNLESQSSLKLDMTERNLHGVITFLSGCRSPH